MLEQRELEYLSEPLEQVVNDGIAQHGLHGGTRAAINRAFGLGLRAPSGRVYVAPILPEHRTLMTQLPSRLSQPQRSNISRFLCHLERLGTPWSTMAPQQGDVRPVPLEQVVNDGIAQHGLNIGTRGALNAAFSLEMRGPSGKRSTIPATPS